MPIALKELLFPLRPSISVDMMQDMPQMDGRMNLVTQNENLKIFIYALTGLCLVLLALSIWWWRRSLNNLNQNNIGAVLPEKKLEPVQTIEPEPDDSELKQLREALKLERAKVVKYEVQKKELLAYIEELKAVHGNIELKHKTIEIQRIFEEQKTDDIVNKVENTAKSLYPELVDALTSNYPEINKLELQYCLMLALGYNLDEVMSILGRSEKAIKSLRYRIRKKMNLDDGLNLREHILEMNDKYSDNQSVT